MYERVAPSGVRVYSEVPFHEYGVWDTNSVLFCAKSYVFTVKRFAKGYWKMLKEAVR